MRGPFTRRCDSHIDEEITSSISESGHETLWCGKGHRVKQWYVVDADGNKMALAHLNTSPQILDTEMLQKLSINPLFKVIVPPKPERLCQRGHNDWYLNPDERYRCRACKRENYERNKAKIAARYQEKKRLRDLARKSDPVYVAKHAAKVRREAEKIAARVMAKKKSKTKNRRKKKNV